MNHRFDKPLIWSTHGKGNGMPLCDWFAGIDMDDREIGAAIGFAQGGSAPRVHASRQFPASNARERRQTLCDVGEWLRMESGGNVRAIAIALRGDAIWAQNSTGECRFSNPVVVDEVMLNQVRQRARNSAEQHGTVLCSAVRDYRCDGRSFPAEPLGLTVRSLMANSISWVAKPADVASIVGSLHESGFVPGVIAPRIVAQAEAATSTLEREQGVSILNVDEDTTEVVVYRDGVLDDLFVVPLGRAQRDNALASACNVPRELLPRLDLERMLASDQYGLYVQRVRSIITAWTSCLARAIRARVEAIGPVWQLRSGLVVGGRVQSLPMVSETAARVFGLPIRFASAEFSTVGLRTPGNLAARGLIQMEWQAAINPSNVVGMSKDIRLSVGKRPRDERGGLAPALGRWLREFVPADHAP